MYCLSRPSTPHTATSTPLKSSFKRTKYSRVFRARRAVAVAERVRARPRFGTVAIAPARSMVMGAAAAMAGKQASDSRGSSQCTAGMSLRRDYRQTSLASQPPPDPDAAPRTLTLTQTCRQKRRGCLPHPTRRRARGSVAWGCVPWRAGPPACARPCAGTRARRS